MSQLKVSALAGALAACLFGTNVHAQSKTSTFDSPMQSIGLNGKVNLQNATMKQDDSKTVCATLAKLTDENAGKDYCIFHIVRWSEPDEKTHLQSVQKEHWYLYDPNDPSDQAYTDNKRLMGVNKFYFFYIHINRAGGPTHPLPVDDKKNPLVSEFKPSYDVVVTKKLSANIQHLLALGTQYLSPPTAQTTTTPSVDGNKLKTMFNGDTFDSEFGGGLVNTLYRPSDIAITPAAVAVSPKSDNPAKADPTEQMAMGTKQTYDNEGKYYFDFSVAVPVKKISQTQIDTTGLTATPINVDGTNAFMLIDGYLPPIDVKNNGWQLIPHPIAGVAFAKQPLHKILVGGALGPKFSELYMGVMWVNQARVGPGADSCQTPPVGAAVPPGTGNHMCPQFTVGLNLPIAAVASRLGRPK